MAGTNEGSTRLRVLPLRGLGALALLFNPLLQRRPRIAISILFVLSALVSVVDSCGVEQRSDAAAAEGASAITSPFYGGADRIGQEAVTVVAIDRSLPEAYGATFWPPPYAAQLAIVEAVLRHRPAAVFLDFTYAEPQNARAPQPTPANWPDATSGPPDITELAPQRDIMAVLEAEAAVERFARALKAVSDFHGVPVFIGRVDETAAEMRALAQRFPEINAGDPVRSGQVGVTINETPLFGYPVEDEHGLLQAAFALRQAVCARRAAHPERYAPCAALSEDALDENMMAINWGVGSPRSMRMLQPGPVAERCVAESVVERMGHALRLAWRHLSGAEARAERPYGEWCTYHAELPASAVLDATLNPVEQAAIDSGEAFDASGLLRDRAVLIGADVAALSDAFDTPLYGLAPGVSVHAMALDNLIEQGDRFTRHPGDVFLSIDHADLLEFAAVIFALAVIFFVAGRRPLEDDGATREVWGVYILVIAITVVVMLAVVSVMRWPAVNLLFITIGLLAAAGWVEAICGSRERSRPQQSGHAEEEPS